MNKNSSERSNAAERMKEYLGKIATGPEQSQDLAEAEAEDALALILSGSISAVRAGVFLIASRMKRETLEENAGFWKALDRTTIKRPTKLDKLLQVADPFDGFDRVPYFGFYAVPVMAAMGLPAYGHSALSLPPKFGVTFEDILQFHYQVPASQDLDARALLIEEYQFGYVGISQSHPALERLRDLRTEIVKRTMLNTFEKILQPLKATDGGNYLATGYFHRGYEVPMMAAAKLSGFDRVLLGNGMEGTTLFGVHKTARVFVAGRTPGGGRLDSDDARQGLSAENPRLPRQLEAPPLQAGPGGTLAGRTPAGEGGEIRLALEEMFSPGVAKDIAGAYADLKKEPVSLSALAERGEAALRGNDGPAAPLIACQAGVLLYLLGFYPNPQAGFDAAAEILRRGGSYESLMRFVERCRQV